MKTRIVNVKMETELHRRFKTYCTAKGSNMQAEIRRLIEESLAKGTRK